MFALVSVTHYVVAVKSIVIVLTINLAWLVRSSIGVNSVVGVCIVVSGHNGVDLLVGVALVEFFEVTKLNGERITIIASWREASVVLGSKMLVAWIESWKKPWLLEIGALMVEI